MIVSIESKSRPCPGVEGAITLAEEVLRRGDILFTAGELIHNRREIDRLHRMGLQKIDTEILADSKKQKEFNGAHFLVRTHGEPENVIRRAEECQLFIVDATCPIVRHSQNIIDQHVKEGWEIIIAGDRDHAEVMGLMAHSKGYGIVVSSIEDAENLKCDDRSLLLAQTTIDPEFFSAVRKTLTTRLKGLKIVDTTCRFLQNRQKDVSEFSVEQDVFILVGGSNSANCELLYNTALKINKRSYRVEEPEEINKKWFKTNDKVGIAGGASTPRWQLEELKTYLDNHHNDKNPKGLENRKGGKFSWRMWKNRKKTK